MTTLVITPDLSKKKAVAVGKIACGEVVDVTIENAATLKTSSLYLRVLVCGKTIAQFPKPVKPGEVLEAWTISGTSLKCNLNLNTVQAYKMICGCEMDCELVLEETGDTTGSYPSLYFTKWIVVKGWPRRPDREELYDLNVYPSLVSDVATLKTNVNNLIQNTYTKAEVQNMIALVSKPLRGTQFRISNAGDVWDVLDFITKALGGTVNGVENPVAENPTITGVIPSADGTAHVLQAVYDGENWTAVVDPEQGE